jgi:phosphatidate cytidylyltransferase
VKHRNLVLRIATSLVAAPLLLGVLLLAPPVAWYAVVALAVAVASAEFFAMTHPDDRTGRIIGMLSCLAASATAYFWSADAQALLTLMLVVTAVGLMVPLWRLGEIRTAPQRMLAGVAGPLYVGVAPTTLALLRRDSPSDGAGYVILALLLAWLADTGAYFCGKHLGRTKLYPAVSPKKTRAGLVGGVLGATAGALLASWWFLPALPSWHALLLGITGGVLGQLGDLTESLLKRATGIKDSGQLLPGHGGILDRIDALLVVGPLVYLYAIWWVGSTS